MFSREFLLLFDSFKRDSNCLSSSSSSKDDSRFPIGLFAVSRIWSCSAANRNSLLLLFRIVLRINVQRFQRIYSERMGPNILHRWLTCCIWLNTLLRLLNYGSYSCLEDWLPATWTSGLETHKYVPCSNLPVMFQIIK